MDTGGHFLGVKRPEREDKHSPPTSTEAKNAWSYTSTPQYIFMVWYLQGPFEKFVDSLLRVGTLCRGGDGLFFEVQPLASDALLTTLHPLLGNVLQTVDHFEISCLGAPFSWLEKPRNRMGRDLDCGLYGEYSDGVPPIHFF
jgi:hypothetical protein